MKFTATQMEINDTCTSSRAYQYHSDVSGLKEFGFPDCVKRSLRLFEMASIPWGKEET